MNTPAKAKSPVKVITDSEELARFCAAQKGADYVTVDTEFLRDKTYWPKLCLVQIAGPEEAAVIDTLAQGLDPAPLYDLLLDQRILKVFHAARQDLEIFFHQIGEMPHPVFDSQVAAMVCGFGDQVGYERLIGELVGAQIDKSSRFTDWSRRPLTEKQLRYALSDVTHLRTAYEKLKKSLQKNDRRHWIEEEMAYLLDPETYNLSPENAWQRLKSRSRDRRYLAILHRLAAWREREAQARDVPRNRILKDEQLYDIAAQSPRTPDNLARTRGLQADFARGKVGKAILTEVEAALALPDDQLPPRPPRGGGGNGQSGTTDLLKTLLRLICEDAGIAQRLVATSDEIEALAGDDEAEVPALKGWRRELFGERALALKHGKLAIALKQGKVTLFDIG